MVDSVSRERLLEMMTAFRATYVLRAALELRVFDALEPGAADAPAVAERLGADPRGTRILLRALAAAGLLATDGETFHLPPGAADLLVSTSPRYCGDNMRVAAGDLEWDTMRHLARAVRTGRPVVEHTADSPDFAYWADFAANLTFVTRAGADFVADLLGGDGPLDVLEAGCGHALYGLTLTGRDPGSRLWCLDGPPVLRAARDQARRLGLTERTSFIEGDVFEAPLGGPYDVILAANLLCQFSRERSVELLRRLAATLRPGGRLVVAGFTTGDEPPARAYHAHMLELLMLAWTSGGQVHSTADLQQMLAASGLAGAEAHTRPGLPVRVVVAERK
ncbi:methyltransferase family protein [Actinoallomurus sp. CA-150999]|uniref:methyltransferase family protein n=1 Tax=Actinoallomurus sp. CA-150999 TaxID=3239887 RepID=UPI003D8B3517